MVYYASLFKRAQPQTKYKIIYIVQHCICTDCLSYHIIQQWITEEAYVWSHRAQLKDPYKEMQYNPSEMQNDHKETKNTFKEQNKHH